MINRKFLLTLILLSSLIISCQGEDIESGEIQNSIEEPEDFDRAPEETPGERACQESLYFDQMQAHLFQRNCKKANSSQLSQVNKGNQKKDKFLAGCYQATNGSCWCDQLIRPNPSSIDSFYCTYGNNQVHQLIHPDESTWRYAYEAVKIVEEFQAKSIFTRIIYNWWRPEPYNKNVGGSASRHPFGTAVDVRFESKTIQNRAFNELCKMRKAGRLRAIGYYASTAIHFGIGDSSANTWGKSCP
ncbi:MAG: hypothetical protein AAF203_08120 [Pseudomonadota bacterium]